MDLVGPSMVLLQVYPPCLTIVELKGDAPGTVDMDRIARRPIPSQTMKVETRQIQVRWFTCHIQRVKNQQRPHLKIRSNPATPAPLEELTQALVLPGSYHKKNVNYELSFVNREFTDHVSAITPRQ